MPEAAVAEAPPSTDQSATGPTAVSDFAREIAQSVKNPTPKAEPEPTLESKTETPKADVTHPEKTDVPPKEAPKESKEKPLSDLTPDELDSVMKKAPSKAWKVYEFFKNKTNTELATLRDKLAKVEAKPETAANDKVIEKYENQIKELSESLKSHLKTISELDYSRSPDFQKKYIARYDNARKSAESEIAQLTITDGETTRQATAQDFDLLMKLPLRDQITRAKTLFGDAADVFFQHRNVLNNIRREGMEALQAANEEAEQRRTQQELQTKEEQRLYDSTLDSEQKALASEFPELFGDTDDPTASEAFGKGLEFSKRVLSSRSNMTPAERASHDAILQMTHAGYRRAVVELKARDAKITELETELNKYRKSDPGKTTTGKPPAPVNDDDVGGIDATAKFIAGNR